MPCSVRSHPLFALLLVLLCACKAGRQAAPPPRIDYKSIPWVQLHPESLRGTREDRIFHQHCTATRPVLITRKKPVFPPSKARAGVWIVDTVIAPDGRLARFRLLKGPSRDKATVRALGDALKEWRFEPAKVEGKPIAVFYVLTVNVHVEPGSAATPPGS